MMKNKRKLTGAETPLEKAVQRWLNSRAADYDDGVEGVLADLMHGGCVSGFVDELVLYSDTLKFYKKHQAEIGRLLSEIIEDYGENPLRNWDKTDPLALDANNQNLLAWFGFEETAKILANRNGIEI